MLYKLIDLFVIMRLAAILRYGPKFISRVMIFVSSISFTIFLALTLCARTYISSSA